MWFQLREPVHDHSLLPPCSNFGQDWSLALHARPKLQLDFLGNYRYLGSMGPYMHVYMYIYYIYTYQAYRLAETQWHVERDCIPTVACGMVRCSELNLVAARLMKLGSPKDPELLKYQVMLQVIYSS